MGPSFPLCEAGGSHATRNSKDSLAIIELFSLPHGMRHAHLLVVGACDGEGPEAAPATPTCRQTCPLPLSCAAPSFAGAGGKATPGVPRMAARALYEARARPEWRSCCPRQIMSAILATSSTDDACSATSHFSGFGSNDPSAALGVSLVEADVAVHLAIPLARLFNGALSTEKPSVLDVSR